MVSPPAECAQQIDERMTAHRRESKYLVTPDQARAVSAEVRRRLESHRHRGEGANTLPEAQHYVTTIYFDTADRALYSAARGSAEAHIKLRAKEYYDLHPGLTETATDPRQLVRYQSVLWLELKHRDGEHTGKRRVGIPKHDLPVFFASGRITSAMLEIQEAKYGVEARTVLDSLAKLVDQCGAPLAADCLVNYRRHAWQDAAGDLRITIDSGLAFFAPPNDLWARDWALVRQTLGTPVAEEPHRILEVKMQGAPPAWLGDLLARLDIASVPFSKFEAASSAVHG